VVGDDDTERDGFGDSAADTFFESKLNATSSTSAAAAAAAATGGGVGGGHVHLIANKNNRVLVNVSPSKAQKAKAAADSAAVQAVLTRKTFKQKLEEEQREHDKRAVESLPETLLPAAAKERENPHHQVDDDD